MEGSDIVNARRRIAPSYAGSIAPPRYSAIFADPEDLAVGASPTQHEFTLYRGLFKRKPLATLRVFSRPSKTSQKHPLYFGGENVAGSIDLKLDTPQAINSISILLKGQLVSSFAEGGYYTFLVHTENVWNKADGDPRGTAAADAGQNAFNGRLLGDLQFSFSFPFPITVDLSTLSSNRAIGPGIPYQTPQTFLEHHVTTNIEYELVLVIAHGGLRPDSKLKARIRFIPKIVPNPLPGLQQLAYRESTSFPGPEIDQDGWHALPTISLSGVLDKDKDANLKYTLYLAEPLCYTRGTVIPCYLLISSQDSRSLEVLANVKIQNVRLVRRIRYFKVPGKAVELHLRGKNPEFLEEVEEVGHAVWWIPPKDVPQQPCLRRLQGEIHLPKELTPSSYFLPLAVEYFVEVLPFITEAFQFPALPNDQYKPNVPQHQQQVLLSYPVVIATFKADGPSPRPFTECPPMLRGQMESYNDPESHNPLSDFGLNHMTPY